MHARGDRITPVKLKRKLTGKIRLAFYQDDPQSDRHTHKGSCSGLISWFNRLMVSLTLCWITEEGVNYGHVEMMFSDGTVVSATERDGVHVLKDKLLSNENYDIILSVKISPQAEALALKKAHTLKGAPFNKLGRVWNNVGALKSIMVVDQDEKGFYCSELVTFLLQVGAAHDGIDLCAALDHRATTPTQLFLYLNKSKYAKLDYNEKEARSLGLNVGQTNGYLSSFMLGGKTKNSSRQTLDKMV